MPAAHLNKLYQSVRANIARSPVADARLASAGEEIARRPGAKARATLATGSADLVASGNVVDIERVRGARTIKRPSSYNAHSIRTGAGAIASGASGASSRRRYMRGAGLLDSPSIALARRDIASRLGLTFKGNRNLDRALGRLETIETSNYIHRYTRGGIAAAIVDKIVKTAMRSGADIYEGDAPNDNSKWNISLDSLFKRLRAWDVLREAFIESRKASYSIIVIGTRLAPGETFASPLDRVRGADDVTYLRPFGESLIYPHSRTDLIDDIESPLFGYPKLYKVRIANRTHNIHYSRVIHVADSLSPWGAPALERVWDYLDDLDKIVGGGAEGTFQNINRGVWKLDSDVSFESDEEGGDGDLDYDEVADQYEEAIAAHRHGLLEDLILQGLEPVDVKRIIPDIASNAGILMRLTAASEEYPERVLFGTEEGKLAGEQDSESYADRVRAFREGFCSRHIEMLTDRFMLIGAQPAASGGYNIAWHSAERLTPADKSTITRNYAAANAVHIKATGEQLITTEEIRRDVLSYNTTEDMSVSQPAAQPATSLRSSELADDAPSEVVIVDATVNELEPDMVDAIDYAISVARDNSQIDEIVSALAAGLESVASDLFSQALTSSAQAMAQLARTGNAIIRSARAGNNSPTFTSLEFDITFDEANPRAIEFASNYAADVVNDITSDARLALNRVIAASTENGLSTAQTANLISNSIGITDHEIGYVTNLLHNMATANVGATVRYGTSKVIIDGTQRQIDRTLRSYTSHLLDVRKRRLARSLLSRSANEGLHELWRQARDSGVLPDNVVRVYLKNTERHADRDGDTVPIGERFPVEPGEDANCGCSSGLQRA